MVSTDCKTALQQEGGHAGISCRSGKASSSNPAGRVSRSTTFRSSRRCAQHQRAGAGAVIGGDGVDDGTVFRNGLSRPAMSQREQAEPDAPGRSIAA